jgi:hypothetical protein
MVEHVKIKNKNDKHVEPEIIIKIIGREIIIK